MKKLLIAILLLGLVLQTTFAIAEEWLVKEKNPPKGRSPWILYEDGTIKKRGPYGHDKDSGRKKSERGRPIHKALEEIANNIGFKTEWMVWCERQIKRCEVLHKQYPDMGYNYSKESWERSLEFTKKQKWIYGEAIKVNAINAVGFTLTTPDNHEALLKASPSIIDKLLRRHKETTLLVTTTLTVSDDYFSSQRHRYDPSVNGGMVKVNEPLRYNAGEVISEQTQKIVLGKDKNTFSFTYAPHPKDITLGEGDIHTKLTITVTEPKSGASYTVPYPWTLRLRPIVVGKFTHNAKGGLLPTERIGD